MRTGGTGHLKISEDLPGNEPGISQVLNHAQRCLTAVLTVVSVYTVW